MTTIVPVSLADRSYEVAIAPGALEDAGTRLARYAPRGRFVVVTDAHVAALHLPRLTASLEASGITVEPIILPAGESTKSWAHLETLTDRLLELIVGTKTAEPVPVALAEDGATQEGDVPATFARIARRAGRFRCLLLRGVLRADGVTVARWHAPFDRLVAVASSPWLHGIAGDHIGALRAACQAMDIEPAILRDNVRDFTQSY